MFYSSYSQEKPQSRTGLRVLYIPAPPSPSLPCCLPLAGHSYKTQPKLSERAARHFLPIGKIVCSCHKSIKSNEIEAWRGETGRDPMSAIYLMSCCHRWTAGRQRAAEVLIISIHSIQWNAIRLNCPGAIANATAAAAMATTATAAVAHCTHLQSADWIHIDILHR